MKTTARLLAATILLAGAAASAQQQYDSLGSPTPRPNQQTSPNKVEPNVPIPGNSSQPATGEPQTTGSGVNVPKDDTTGKAPAVDTRTPTPADTGATPGGLTPD